jgi:hypothetical protein
VKLEPRVVVATGPIHSHPAVLAWRMLGFERSRPTAVAALIALGRTRDRSGTAAYRLWMRGGPATTMVAKRMSRAALLIETTVYERILPTLSVSSLRSYGWCLDDDSQSGWIFLQDAGDTPWRSDVPADAALTAAWLAALHGATAAQDLHRILPERGPRHYQRHLQAARDRVTETLANRVLSPEDRHVLADVVGVLNRIEHRWPVIEQSCADMPHCLAHGDFVPKNVHIGMEGRSRRLLVMDWETSGWGPPAVDLARIDLDHYQRAVAAAGSAVAALAGSRLRAAAQLGRVLRLIAAIDWASESLPYPPIDRPICLLSTYLNRLRGHQAAPV